MSRVDELPPDQRAALSLLLRQRKSYAEVAAMLGIAERAVHDRAHAALAVLAPREARDLDPERREEIGDYLLGQRASVGEQLRTRTLLSNSVAANTWARSLAAALGSLAEGELPEIPGLGEGQVAAGPAAQEPYPLAQAAAASAGAGAPVQPGGRTYPAPSSRVGGALLLAAILAVVVVVLAVVLSGGSSHKKNSSASGGTAGAKTTTGPATEGRFTLKPPAGASSRSTGTVEILSEGGKRAFYIQAEHIPATRHFFYAIWLYNSRTSALPLSKSPPVGKSHKLAGAALLPKNAGSYREIMLTRETSTRPTHPGHIVLRGRFSVKG
jgi:hypothetical protein